jgi:SAM-dependent methyltransferase
LHEFAQQYREARLRQGWPPLTQEQALGLPYSQPAGTPALYWQVRRQSFCALMSVLARQGPTPAHGPAADLGAGVGWLSYRLAQIGYQVLAVDISRDADWGLGVAERYYLSQANFQLILGNLEYPPLQAGHLSLIVFNASLHYASDLEGTLVRAARVLQPGGRIIILDTPIGRRPLPGTGQGDRHLGRRELSRALLGAGLNPRWIAVRRGARWWRHQAIAILRRDAIFSFPMIVAYRLR